MTNVDFLMSVTLYPKHRDPWDILGLTGINVWDKRGDRNTPELIGFIRETSWLDGLIKTVEGRENKPHFTLLDNKILLPSNIKNRISKKLVMLDKATTLKQEGLLFIEYKEANCRNGWYDCWFEISDDFSLEKLYSNRYLATTQQPSTNGD